MIISAEEHLEGIRVAVSDLVSQGSGHFQRDSFIALHSKYGKMAVKPIAHSIDEHELYQKLWYVGSY